MKFTLYTATCRENAKNIKYPNDVEVIEKQCKLHRKRLPDV